MKINLKKDSLNDKLKKIWRPFNPPIKVVEQGNDYLILRRSEENSLLIVYSFLISLVITPIVNFILASSLHDIINFNLANSLHDIINFNLPSSLYDTIFQNIHILFILTHVEVIIFAYLTFLLLKKLNFLFFEVRFIANKLTVINTISKREIILDDKVKFSIEKELGYKSAYIYIYIKYKLLL